MSTAFPAVTSPCISDLILYLVKAKQDLVLFENFRFVPFNLTAYTA